MSTKPKPPPLDAMEEGGIWDASGSTSPGTGKGAQRAGVPHGQPTGDEGAARSHRCRRSGSREQLGDEHAQGRLTVGRRTERQVARLARLLEPMEPSEEHVISEDEVHEGMEIRGRGLGKGKHAMAPHQPTQTGGETIGTGKGVRSRIGSMRGEWSAPRDRRRELQDGGGFAGTSPGVCSSSQTSAECSGYGSAAATGVRGGLAPGKAEINLAAQLTGSLLDGQQAALRRAEDTGRVSGAAPAGDNVQRVRPTRHDTVQLSPPASKRPKGSVASELRDAERAGGLTTAAAAPCPGGEVGAAS